MESCKITFCFEEGTAVKTVSVPRGTTVLEAAIKAKIKLNAPCGGNGQCGRCRVKIEEGVFFDMQPYGHLTSEEVSEGICLACMTHAQGDLKISIPSETLLKKAVPEEKLTPREKVMTKPWEIKPLSTFKPYGLAVDIGTTTVVVNLVHLKEGKPLLTRSRFNAQMSCGNDVISRIVYAKSSERQLRLKSLVVDTINEIIEELISVEKISFEDIGCISCAGNTTMIYLLLGLNPQPIRENPFMKAQFNTTFMAKDLGLKASSEALVYLVPGVGSFVGGDITAGILSVGMYNSKELSMYIDIGTNGEVALGNKDWLLASSCSAGPAFEGAGVKFGQRAITGAIEKISIDPKNLNPVFQVIGEDKPTGICGSGMIDLLAEMFRCKIIDRIGKINLDLNNPRLRKGEDGKEYILAWAKDTAVKKDITINEVDIDNLIRTKAAIYAGLTVLLNSLNLSFEKINQIFIAGAFGSYLDINNGIAIGLFPDIPIDKFKFVGNGSLSGAQLTLLFENFRVETSSLSSKITYLDLGSSAKFMDDYTAALFLPHTDLSLFPSQSHKS